MGPERAKRAKGRHHALVGLIFAKLRLANEDGPKAMTKRCRGSLPRSTLAKTSMNHKRAATGGIEEEVAFHGGGGAETFAGRAERPLLGR